MTNVEAQWSDAESGLKASESQDLLRFITCGSVDDGKSTLIGRLLYESKEIFDDQLALLEADSRKIGTQGGSLDLALLVDGLAAEREQGITIDVAYCFFSTRRRRFIVADTPGHEQYTRNMVTGASTADVAIILIDARKGVLTQTRRHSYIATLLGIKRLVLAINKMDLVNYSQQIFDAIVREYRAFASQIPGCDFVPIPLSALLGDNVLEHSSNMSWHHGPELLGYLESVSIDDTWKSAFRFPVQWVNRPHSEFRGVSGLVASGTISQGDAVRVLPRGLETHIARIITFDGDLQTANAGQSVTLTFADELDVSRGDLVTVPQAPAVTSDQIQATIIWMHDDPMLPGRPYIIKFATSNAVGTVTALKHKLNVNTLEKLAAKQLGLNEIGLCNLSLNRMIAFDPYEENRVTGGFVMIDKVSNETVGAGLVRFALRRADSIHWQAFEISGGRRAALKGQRPCVLWFTGLSGAGKSTLANLVEKRLFEHEYHTYVLDGDNLRHGLNKDLGFSDAERVENIRRTAEVARLMVDAGLIVLVAMISPFRSERRLARELLSGSGSEFLEIFVDTPLEEAERRDPKGLYKKAHRGELKNFTGVGSEYETPERPEMRLNTLLHSPDATADQILGELTLRGILPPSSGFE